MAPAVTNTTTANSRDNGNSDGGGWLGDRELRTEVETLGSIRHKNIVKLYCCYSGADCNLLVYEYMPNGCWTMVAAAACVRGRWWQRAAWWRRRGRATCGVGGFFYIF